MYPDGQSGGDSVTGTYGAENFMGNGKLSNQRTALKCNFHDCLCDINLLKNAFNTGSPMWSIWCQEIQADGIKCLIVIEKADHVELCASNNTESVMNKRIGLQCCVWKGMLLVR